MSTILVIEDNFEIRENSVEMLELEGYTVITAINEALGIKEAVENIPDLILCDIMMPEVDGFEVFEQLKNNSSTAHIPLIFISASVGKKEIDSGLAMGAAGYIRKPFEAEDLIRTIESCIRKNAAI